MRWAGLFIILIFVCLPVFAVNLVPCPDCEQQVSPRALLCPHCGCPGQAIKDAVAEREAANRPPPIYPVAVFKAGVQEGVAVAYTDGETRYLLLNAYPLMGAASLEITPVATNTSIPYHTMQVAADAPLVRFQTTATNLVFLRRARLRAGRVDDPAWLHSDGRTAPRKASEGPPASVAALVDAQTNLVAVIAHAFDGSPIHVPLSMTWVDIAPGQFRNQTASLLAAHQAVVQKELTPEMIEQMKKTKWATPFFERTAEKIIKLSEQEDRNAVP